MRRSALSIVSLFSILASLAEAQVAVPDGLRKLYDSIKAQGQCNNVLASGFNGGTGSGDNGGCCLTRP
jgi:hypothetical protein